MNLEDQLMIQSNEQYKPKQIVGRASKKVKAPVEKLSIQVFLWRAIADPRGIAIAYEIIKPINPATAELAIIDGY